MVTRAYTNVAYVGGNLKPFLFYRIFKNPYKPCVRTASHNGVLAIPLRHFHSLLYTFYITYSAFIF